jgi:hypothetical protein
LSEVIKDGGLLTKNGQHTLAFVIGIILDNFADWSRYLQAGFRMQAGRYTC